MNKRLIPLHISEYLASTVEAVDGSYASGWTHQVWQSQACLFCPCQARLTRCLWTCAAVHAWKSLFEWCIRSQAVGFIFLNVASHISVHLLRSLIKQLIMTYDSRRKVMRERERGRSHWTFCLTSLTDQLKINLQLCVTSNRGKNISPEPLLWKLRPKATGQRLQSALMCRLALNRLTLSTAWIS